ncbi:MAG: DUF559 domain-containing protein [Firmicutes bacterium]|nr:DUF559 domain-containing protein [Bacillota bacterium]
MRFEPSKTGAQKLLAEKLRAEEIAFLENQWLEGWEVDIFLPQYYLVIEIDGFYHLTTKQQEKDRAKAQRLEAAGYHVLRFTNSQIYQDCKGCLQVIKAVLNNQERQIKRGAQVEAGPTPWQEKLAVLQRKLKAMEEKK